jgi:Sec-independent protein secretion pathway component TatC
MAAKILAASIPVLYSRALAVLRLTDSNSWSKPRSRCYFLILVFISLRSVIDITVDVVLTNLTCTLLTKFISICARRVMGLPIKS